MKKIMILMAAAMITAGGITVANAQAKPAAAPAKTEQTGKATKEKAHKNSHHAAKHHKTAKKAQK